MTTRRLRARAIWLLLLAALAAGTLLTAQGCARQARLDRLTFFISGNTHGFLENCGCAGGQSGGLQRRARIIEVEKAAAIKPLPAEKLPSDAIVIDTGDFTDPSDERMKLRSKGVVESMGVIGYDAVGLGTYELNYPPEELYELLRKAPNLHYLAANLEFTKPAQGEDVSGKLDAMVAPYRIATTAHGFKVGIIHVIDNAGVETRGTSIRDGYKLSEPIAAARDILDKHRDEAQFWVLSAGSVTRYGLRNDAVAALTDLQLVFGFRGRNPNSSTEGAAFPYFIERPYDKGKDVTKVTITFNPDNKLVVDSLRIAVKATYDPDPKVQKIIDDLKPELEKLENALAEEAQKKHLLSKDQPQYIGHLACDKCHADIGLEMAMTKHMFAYETLVGKGKQHTDCARCHNVGYNQSGGWNVIEDRKVANGNDWDRRNVQCENCHGPGEYHAKLHANGWTAAKHPELSKDGRDKEGLVLVDRSTCLVCHNPENSPHFDFDLYWPHIQHGKNKQGQVVKPVIGSPPGAGMGAGPGDGDLPGTKLPRMDSAELGSHASESIQRLQGLLGR